MEARVQVIKMGKEEDLAFTVASVWREERVSCPHPDILRAFLSSALSEEAGAFVEFHLRESQCPYCSAVLEDMRAVEEDAGKEQLEDLRDRLMRSTVAELKKASGS